MKVRVLLASSAATAGMVPAQAKVSADKADGSARLHRQAPGQQPLSLNQFSPSAAAQDGH